MESLTYAGSDGDLDLNEYFSQTRSTAFFHGGQQMLINEKKNDYIMKADGGGTTLDQLQGKAMHENHPGFHQLCWQLTSFQLEMKSMGETGGIKEIRTKWDFWLIRKNFFQPRFADLHRLQF